MAPLTPRSARSLAVLPLLTVVLAASASAQRGRSGLDLDSSWRLRRQSAEPWGVEGVSLIDVSDGAIRSRVHLVVTGDLVTAIDEGPLPEGVEVVARGGWIVPGLFDLHAHCQAVPGSTRAEVARTLLDHGVTVIREIPLITEFAVRFAADTASGQLVGPTVVPASSVFEREPQRSQKGFGDPATAADWVRREALAGARWIKVYNKMDAASLRAIVDTASAHGLRVCGHSEDVPPREALECGMQCFEHIVSFPRSCLDLDAPEPEVQTLTQQIAWRWSNVDDDRCLELLAEFRAKQAAWVPTLVVVERIIEQGGHMFRGTMSEEDRDALRAALELAAEWAVEHHRAGGIVALGTDFPVDGVVPGESAHRELELLVELGTATPLEALQIGTLGSARALGLDRLLGRVEVGMLAHFLVLRENPLDDLQHLRRPTLVVHDGRRHTPSDED